MKLVPFCQNIFKIDAHHSGVYGHVLVGVSFSYVFLSFVFLYECLWLIVSGDFLSFYVSLSVCVCRCVSLCVCMYLWLCVCGSESIYVCLSLFVWDWVSVNTWLWGCISFFWLFYLVVYIYVTFFLSDWVWVRVHVRVSSIKNTSAMIAAWYTWFYLKWSVRWSAEFIVFQDENPKGSDMSCKQTSVISSFHVLWNSWTFNNLLACVRSPP